MAAVHKQDPGAVKELLAYMFTIIRAAQELEDPAWRNYDEAFREKAAATGNRKWSHCLHLIALMVLTQLIPTHPQQPRQCHKGNTQTHLHLSALHQCRLDKFTRKEQCMLPVQSGYIPLWKFLQIPARAQSARAATPKYLAKPGSPLLHSRAPESKP